MLTFNLKKEWFEKIKSGEKTHEYREVKEYWIKRLINICKNNFIKEIIKIDSENKNNFFVKTEFENICFCCGYTNTNDKQKRLLAKIKTLSLRTNGLNTDLKIDKPVFDIEFELIEEAK